MLLISVKDFFTRLLILSIALCSVIKGENRFRKYCQSVSASCGTCLKAHPECAWCTDSSFQSEHRCDTSEHLREACPKFLVDQAKSKIEITQDKPLGSPHTYLQSKTQLQPQQLQLTMKPGETLTFPLKYAHADPENSDVYILNSETESQGLRLELTSDCPRPQQEDQRSCTGVQPKDILSYNVSLTLIDCITSGDAVVSVGIGGVRDVVAVYITPVCGCECEKLAFQELQSPTCQRNGNLVCGKCVCKEGFTGMKCECDDKTTGGDGNCRAKPGDPVCSNRGACSCGRCVCQNTPSAVFYGQFCECSNENCPKSNDQMCSGSGHCQCGQCICNPGWTGPDCACSMGQEMCLAKNGKLCNEAGYCQCNKCVCDESSGFSGPACELMSHHPIEDTKAEMPPMTNSMEESHTPRYFEEEQTTTTTTTMFHHEHMEEKAMIHHHHQSHEKTMHKSKEKSSKSMDHDDEHMMHTDDATDMLETTKEMMMTTTTTTTSISDTMISKEEGMMEKDTVVPSVVHNPLGGAPEQHGETGYQKNQDKIVAAGHGAKPSSAPRFLMRLDLARFVLLIFVALITRIFV